MPVYRYKAVNPAGDVAIGELEAANEGEIVDRLRDQGMMPMHVAAAAADAQGQSAGDMRAAGAGAGTRRGWFTPKKVTRDHHVLKPKNGFKFRVSYIPNVPREKEIRTAVSNSFGFGGHNAVIVLRRFEE